jgi:hypothetical protein
MKIKDLNPRFGGIKDAVIFVTTSHFTLQTASAFIRINE